MSGQSNSGAESAWRCVASLEGHQGAVYDLASAGPDLLWSVGGDGCLVRWVRGDLGWKPTGEAVAKADEALFCVHALSGGGAVCGGASGGIVVWESGVVKFHSGHDGGTFVVSEDFSAGADGAIRRWNSGELIAQVNGRVRCLMDRPDGVWTGTHEGKAHRAGARQGQLLHEGSLRAMVEWPGKPAIGTAGADGRIRIWRAVGEQLEEIVTIEAHKAAIYRLKGSPDGLRMATASRDRSAAVWNSADLSLEARLARSGSGGHTRSVNALCWLDDRTLASGGDDRRIFIWERNPD